MIPLNEINPERIRSVREKTLVGRGCGKTTERMVTLLSYLRPENDNKKYLFVGENTWHVRDIYHVYYDWLRELGTCHEYLANGFGHVVQLPMPPKPSTILGKLAAFFKSPIHPPKISFEFTTAERVYTRGRHYDKIILDLTSEKYYKNQRRIEEAMWAEK